MLNLYGFMQKKSVVTNLIIMGYGEYYKYYLLDNSNIWYCRVRDSYSIIRFCIW